MAVPVIQKAKTQLVIRDPFYAAILLNLEIVETTTTPDGRPLWLAATNGTQLFVNPHEVNKLPLGEAIGLLKHEVMHVANLHPWRGLGKEPDRWNQACDYAINPIIVDEGGELPAGGLNSPAFKGMSAEQIYAQLPPIPPGSGGDRDVLAPVDPSQAAQAKAKVMIASAATAAKSMDKLPGHLRGMLEDVFNPKVPWKEQLREWLTETAPTDYSYAKLNRRFLAGDAPIALPGLAGEDGMDAFGIVIDCSGSISVDELKQYLGEASGAVAETRPNKLVIAYCDAKVQHHDVFDNPDEAKVLEKLETYGGGGTNMPAALTWFTRKYPSVKGVIVMTDGYTPFGEETDYDFPVLWAITSPSITAPWGRTLHIATGED